MVSASPDIFEIFSEAVGIESPAERKRYLDEACGFDPQARVRVDALLQAHSTAGNFLGGPVSLDDTKVHVNAATWNSTIGRYQLREVLGSGGMGIVYAAEQQAPLRRQVALKVIKPGMDSREVLARFDAERQALALMEHPGIARVFDAGTTDAGHPYFVMELVRGLPITDYCDHHRLPIVDRVKLFITVCQAVHHAHRKGVIHRDLKPSNVLVAEQDGAPVPKVIDFGIAKATTAHVIDQPHLTQQAQVLGTPMSMSPEQAGLGSNLDTRSDVYSLGVLLYELLTGRTPFERELLSTESFDELRRIIREVAPPSPSRRVSRLNREQRVNVARDRGVDEEYFGRSLEGNLDSIVMQALAKEPTHRYESAAALAADLQRYLDRQPVCAGSSSFADRVRRLSGRNRIAFTVAAVLVAAMVSAYAALTSSMLSERMTAVFTDLPQQESSDPLLSQSQPPLSRPDHDASTTAEAELITQDATLPVTNLVAEASPDHGDANAEPARDPDAVPSGDPAIILSLAVFPFEERGSGTKGYGSKISDFLVASLAATPEFIVVERAELNKTLDEQKLSVSGLIRPDEAVQIGRLTGAKLIVLGSILELDSTLILSARITSTETGRIAAATVKGRTNEDLAELADKLAQQVFATLGQRAEELVPKPVNYTDRLAEIKAAIGDRPLPKVWLHVTEEHVGQAAINQQATIDPAAETELAKLMEGAGFTVIDHKEGNRKQADVIVEGEAFSEFALRHNDLISVKARVEVKAVRASTGERIATDQQTEIVVDVAEQITGKTALQNAAAEIALRLLPKLANLPAN